MRILNIVMYYLRGDKKIQDLIFERKRLKRILVNFCGFWICLLFECKDGFIMNTFIKFIKLYYLMGLDQWKEFQRKSKKIKMVKKKLS